MAVEMQMAGAASGGGELGIFSLAERRLGWLEQRQRVLAQNIANADTPGYVPKDLSPFAKLLAHAPITPVRTDALHLAGLHGNVATITPLARQRGADGNAVAAEDQMTRVADDETSQALVGNLWKSYMGMFMTALGRGS